MHDLVGRDRELTTLDEAWRRAMAGDRTVALITGEPGIGKTRLLDELAARVSASGGSLAWGRTAEIGHTPAFWPWLQILSALEVDDDRAPAIGSLEQHPGAASRLALFDATAAFLARRAAARPLALLFDDIHAADPSSLQLLDYVVPLLAGKRVLFALAARDADASADVAAVLARIQRGAKRIPLARLTREHVAALVADRADATRVFELSEGNPLFVEELVASLQGEGVLGLPRLSSVRAFIAERVARLPESARRSLVAAALVGRTFSARVVEEIVGEPANTLQPALKLGMIAMTAPDRYKFSHALVAEAIADELDPSERARLHLRAAQAIEKHDRTDASAIAHHLLAAGHLAAEAAVSAAERAARDAMTRHAFEDAASLLDRAVTALALAAPTDKRRYVELAALRAEALAQADQHARAVEILDQLVPIARGLGDAELLARLALVRGMKWSFGVTDPLLVAALREALGGVPAGVLRARVLARLAAAEQPALDPYVPVAHAKEAIAMAAGFAARDRLDVLYTATGALVDYVPPDELEALHRDVLELARSEDARVIAVHTQLRICFTTIERGDRVAFEQAIAAYRAMAMSLGSPRWLRFAFMLDTMPALLDGRFADADRSAAEALRINEQLGDKHALDLVGVHRAVAAFVHCASLPVLPFDVSALGPGQPIVLAWHAGHEGRLDDARQRLIGCPDEMLADKNTGAMIATTVAVAGEPEHARRVYDRMVGLRGQIVVASMIGFAVQDLIDRVLLVLAARMQNWDVIDEHAQAALAVATKIASPVWLARVRADWADALLARDRGGDADRARELWQSALADAERLDMPMLAVRGRRALGAAPAPRPVAKLAAPDAIHIARSGELWTVAGFGEEIHVKDSRGIQMLARLVDERGREVHALELAGGAGSDGGDAGELLDQTARAQYRERLAELVAERDKAAEWGDVGRAERASEEIEAITAELERAVGLGGRDRRAASGTERARSNVQRRILHAIQQIRGASQRLGEHFAASVRTGTYCCYDPS